MDKYLGFNKIKLLLYSLICQDFFPLLDLSPYLTNFSSNHCEFCHREMLEFAFKKGLLFLKWLSLSRINIPGVFSFGYSSTVTQYTALLLQNGLRSILKSHTYSYFSCICLHIHVIQHPNENWRLCRENANANHAMSYKILCSFPYPLPCWIAYGNFQHCILASEFFCEIVTFISRLSSFNNFFFDIINFATKNFKR